MLGRAGSAGRSCGDRGSGAVYEGVETLPQIGQPQPRLAATTAASRSAPRPLYHCRPARIHRHQHRVLAAMLSLPVARGARCACSPEADTTGSSSEWTQTSSKRLSPGPVGGAMRSAAPPYHAEADPSADHDPSQTFDALNAPEPPFGMPFQTSGERGCVAPNVHSAAAGRGVLAMTARWPPAPPRGVSRWWFR
jgi:hypothetical protein